MAMRVVHQLAPRCVSVTFHPDSTLALDATIGTAYADVHRPLQVKLRAMYASLSRRMVDQCAHIKSHAGHPWNELADSIASRAMESVHLRPLSRPEGTGGRPRVPDFDVECAAGLFDGPQYPVAEGADWRLPVLLPTDDVEKCVRATHPFVLPRSPPGRSRAAVGPKRPPCLHVAFATANVLTLDAKQCAKRADSSAAEVVSGRAKLLQAEATSAGLHVVGIQEGRWPSNAELTSGDYY
eukprot:10115020-Alexandrium_andersonii.AAC.1